MVSFLDVSVILVFALFVISVFAKSNMEGRFGFRMGKRSSELVDEMIVRLESLMADPKTDACPKINRRVEQVKNASYSLGEVCQIPDLLAVNIDAQPTVIFKIISDTLKAKRGEVSTSKCTRHLKRLHRTIMFTIPCPCPEGGCASDRPPV